jgi:hypothetical protein
MLRHNHSSPFLSGASPIAPQFISIDVRQRVSSPIPLIRNRQVLVSETLMFVVN